MSKEKDPAAVALGRKGGAAKVPKGFAMMTKAKRVAAAKKSVAIQKEKKKALQSISANARIEGVEGE